MAELFSNKKECVNKPNNQETKYKSSIANLLLVVAFSVVNIVLLVTNANTYFLFSAFIPYIAVDYGMYFCGLYPEEYYYDVPDMIFADRSYMAIAVGVAVIVLLIYFLCWYLAKKKKISAVIFALVLFVIDTLTMLWFTGFSMDSIFDILIHIWVIYYMVIAIVTYYRMKKVTDCELCQMSESAEENLDSDEEITGNSKVLRVADDVKCRVFLEAEVSGMHIVYRRVKIINELVINGCVYDEYEALVEYPHSLIAYVNGHKVEACCDKSSRLKIFVDSELIAKKMRIF